MVRCRSAWQPSASCGRARIPPASPRTPLSIASRGRPPGGADGARHPLLLEADLSTQSKAAFAEKLVGYALYRKTPMVAKRFGSAPFRLWIVTRSEERRGRERGLVQRLG